MSSDDVPSESITLGGIVTDAVTGRPVQGLTITETRTEYGVEPYVVTTSTTSTDSDGHYQFDTMGQCSLTEQFSASNGIVILQGGTSAGGCLLSSNDHMDFPVGIFNKLENAGVSKCNESAGEPVNVTNGNMYLQQTDYQLPGAGEGLIVRRTYNSISQNIGLFGRGWSTIFDETMTTAGSLLQLTLPDGRVVTPASPDFYGQMIKNGDGSYTVTFKDGEVHQFNAWGRLISLTDRHGNQTVLTYTSGKLSSITDPFARVLTVTTDGSENVLSLSDSLGTIATYTYGGSNQLLTTTYADSSGYTYSYTGIPAGLGLSTVTDALGNISEHHEYDTQGRATTSEVQGGVDKYTLNYVSISETDVTDALGHVTKYFYGNIKGRLVVTRIEGLCGCGGGSSQAQTWTYDNQANVTAMTDALNHTTSNTYDTSGNKLTETNSLGTTTNTYNPLGEVLTSTDAMNGVWTNTYDSQGNQLTAKDALNNTTTLTYDTHGRPLTVSDPRSNVTSITYDSYGNLTRQTDALTKHTDFTYDARGRVTSMTNALSQVTSYEYDLAGRLKKVIYPDTNFVLFTYDLGGRKTKVKDPRGNETNFAYDGANRLTSETDADNKVTSYTYDLMSKRASITDALNRTTNYSYDDFNHLKQVTYPEASTGAGHAHVDFAYDLGGNLTTRTDQAGRVTTLGYDNADRLTTVTDPASKVTAYEYNARSQKTAVVDALSQRYEFVHDALGSVTQEKKGTATKSFVYDAAGNRTQRTDYNGAVTNYTFDELNRPTLVSYPDTTSASYGYDVLSRLTTATNPNGTVTMAYDNRSRVSSVTDVFSQVVSYAYDANSNRSQLSLNGGTSATYQYDVINRPTQITDAASLSASFGYDATGKVTSRTLPNGVATSYQYDGLNRLTSLTHSKGANTLADFQYQFNAVNEISQLTDGAGAHNYTYDTRDRLTAATHPNQTNESYTFDDVGNRTASQQGSSYTYLGFNRLSAANGSTFTYDANGNLSAKTDASGSWSYSWDYEDRLKQASKSGGVTVIYAYDALGRRIQRSSTSGATTKFVYDGADVVRDLDSAGATVAEYLNGPGVDNKLRQTVGGTASYFLTDQQGSTRALADASGSVASTLDYDSFGNVISGSASTRYTYTSRESDSDTGLMYYRARWYDPAQGHFISEDPIGFSGGANFYSYVGNNPTNFTDPSGLCPQDTGEQGSTEDCHIDINYSGNLSSASPQFKQGPDHTKLGKYISEGASGSHAFRFEVTGSVADGGIGFVGPPTRSPDVGEVPGNGIWTVGQKIDGTSNARFSKSGWISIPIPADHDDSPLPNVRNIQGNAFAWHDAPGAYNYRGNDVDDKLVEFKFEATFHVSATDGQRHCSRTFRISQSYRRGVFKGTINILN